MSLSALRELLAGGLRAVPWLPGHRPIRRRINRTLLALGAEPIAIAPLQSGLKISVDLRTNMQRDVLYVGGYDERLLACCVRLLPSKPVVLDVGANIGLTLLPLAVAARERGGSAHGFEPVPANLDVLHKNVALNKLDSVIKVWPFGLSSEHGQAQISLREDFVSGGASGNASLVIAANESHFATQTIELRTLDEVYESLGCDQIDFMKIDIEGHEDHFLRGAQKTLARHRPILMMEINKPYYARRNVDLDQELPPLLQGFKVLRSEGGHYRHWLEMTSVNECQRLDNVFVVPRDRCAEVLATLNAS